MERDIRLVADNPTVVSGRNVEDIASFHLYYFSIRHCCSGAAGDDHTDVLYLAESLIGSRSNVDGPFPSWLVGCAADHHSVDLDRLEFSLREFADLICVFKSLQNYIEH